MLYILFNKRRRQAIERLVNLTGSHGARSRWSASTTCQVVYHYSTPPIRHGRTRSSITIITAHCAQTRSCFYHLRQLQMVSHSLSSSSTATLVYTFIQL